MTQIFQKQVKRWCGLDILGQTLQQSVVPRVVLDSVSKVFQGPRGSDIHAANCLSFSVEENECLALVGPSGSGKTTALRLVAGLEAPTSGTIMIGNRVVNNIPPKDRDVAMVFQNPALYPHMSVYENIGFGLKLRRWPRQEADARIRDLAAMLGLTSVLNSKPMTLSGGQRQRVAIGRALARRPGVLLLDEPLANLDPPLRTQMRSELISLRQRFGTTMIHVTHDHLEARLLGDRVAILSDGVLQQAGSPRALYERPANRFVACFFGAQPMNLFSGVLSRQENRLLLRLSPAGGDSAGAAADDPYITIGSANSSHLDIYLNKPIVLGIRPEHIKQTHEKDRNSGFSTFRGKVISLENTGADLFVHGFIQGHPFVARLTADSAIETGIEYSFQSDPLELCWFEATNGQAIPTA